MIEKSMDDEQRVGGEGSGVEGVREECTIMMIDDPELRESSSDEVKGLVSFDIIISDKSCGSYTLLSFSFSFHFLLLPLPRPTTPIFDV